MAESTLERFGWIVTTLKRVLGGGAAYGMTGFLMLRIHARIARIGQLMPQALARVAWPIRPRRPRASPAVPRPAPPPLHPADAWRRIRLPRGEAWLIRMLPVLAQPCAIALQQMLAEPDMAALAATPRAHRLLRPLCRMLGVSDCLPALAAPDGPAATPTAAALAARLPPPLPPATDPWATCAQPTVDLYPRQNLYRAI